MYCKQCGQQIPNNASFCAKCGSPVKATIPVKQRNPFIAELLSSKALLIFSVIYTVIYVLLNEFAYSSNEVFNALIDSLLRFGFAFYLSALTYCLVTRSVALYAIFILPYLVEYVSFYFRLKQWWTWNDFFLPYTRASIVSWCVLLIILCEINLILSSRLTQIPRYIILMIPVILYDYIRPIIFQFIGINVSLDWDVSDWEMYFDASFYYITASALFIFILTRKNNKEVN